MIPRDKVLHLCLGSLWFCAAFVSYLVLASAGVGAFLAFQTTVYAILYELSQWVRKEGEPDLLDAAATAAPGWVAWLILANV
jgi:hypothetical protein